VQVPANYASYPSAYMPLGEASVCVHYEMIGGQASLLAVVINGMAIIPEDWLPNHVLDNWASELERGAFEDRQRRLELVAAREGVPVEALMHREAA